MELWNDQRANTFISGQNNLLSVSKMIHFQIVTLYNIINKWPWYYTEVLNGTGLLDDSFPNSLPLFGPGIRMKSGGFVKADFIRVFHYAGDAYEFELGSIAVDGSREHYLGGMTTFHAKQSRMTRTSN
ncbi:MAG: hypothetical protein P8Y08_13220 [Desulfobulbaceae bacterium]